MTDEIPTYDDMLGDIERTLGEVPGFMKVFPREVLVRDWPLFKSLGEIDFERARYLLNVDELLEEMLDETRSEIANNMKVEFSEAGTISCEELAKNELMHSVPDSLKPSGILKWTLNALIFS